MDWMWLIILVVAAFVLTSAYRLMKGLGSASSRRLAPLAGNYPGQAACACASAVRRRRAKCISLNQCERLLHDSGDVIFVLIRSKGRKESVSFLGTHALCIAPMHLDEVLRWLPTESSIVLLGEVELCPTVVLCDQDIAGETSLYVMSEGPRALEVA